jgi:hypothetical protein
LSIFDEIAFCNEFLFVSQLEKLDWTPEQSFGFAQRILSKINRKASCQTFGYVVVEICTLLLRVGECPSYQCSQHLSKYHEYRRALSHYQFLLSDRVDIVILWLGEQHQSNSTISFDCKYFHICIWNINICKGWANVSQFGVPAVPWSLMWGQLFLR